MRFQSGSNSGSRQGQQQQGSGGEQKQWPFKAFEYPPEPGPSEYSLESLKEESNPRPSSQQGGG